MLEEFSRVALTSDMPERGLRVGATGTIVDVHTNPDAYMVEFTANGRTLAIVAVRPDQVRQLTRNERAAARHRGIAAR